MTKSELQARVDAATKNIDLSDLAEYGVELVKDNSFDEYWANSASQSYVNAVERGNVRTVNLG